MHIYWVSNHGRDFAVLPDSCLNATYVFSIAGGMALGFISYPLIKLFCGKAREVHWCIYPAAILFVFRYSVS